MFWGDKGFAFLQPLRDSKFKRQFSDRRRWKRSVSQSEWGRRRRNHHRKTDLLSGKSKTTGSLFTSHSTHRSQPLLTLSVSNLVDYSGFRSLWIWVASKFNLVILIVFVSLQIMCSTKVLRMQKSTNSLLRISSMPPSRVSMVIWSKSEKLNLGRFHEIAISWAQFCFHSVWLYGATVIVFRYCICLWAN